MSEEDFEYNCEGNHLQVGNRCMKCNAIFIDFGDYNEGNGFTTGWTEMKGKIGNKWPVIKDTTVREEPQ